MVKIFVYGTLRPDQPGYWWFVGHSPQIEFLGNSLATLSGYSLFESEGRPFISKNGDSVYGFLLIARAKDGITDENVIQQFDDYEGIDGSDDFSFYERKELDVFVSEKTVSAWCYVLKDENNFQTRNGANYIPGGTWGVDSDVVIRDHLVATLIWRDEIIREIESVGPRVNHSTDGRWSPELSRTLVILQGNFLVLFSIFERILRNLNPSMKLNDLLEQIEVEPKFQSIKRKAAAAGSQVKPDHDGVYFFSAKGRSYISLKKFPFKFANKVRNNSIHNSKTPEIRNLNLLLAASAIVATALPELVETLKMKS